MFVLILELLAPVLVTYIGYRIINRIRRGRVVGSGVWEIRKASQSNVFEGKVKMNGQSIACIFDTGASVTSLGYNDARKIGIDVDNLMFIIDTDTAVGEVRNESAETEIDVVEVGPIRVRHMGAFVSRTRATGCLLGMNFFSNLDSFEIKKDRLILRHGGERSSADPDRATRSSGEFEREGHAPGQAERSKPGSHKARAQSPTHSPGEERVTAKCPFCNCAMTLPSGRRGRVLCVGCGQRFHASTIGDADAVTRPLRDDPCSVD